MSVFAYPTEHERLEARRAAFRRNKDNQYKLYKELLAEFDLPFAVPGSAWATHLSEIRHLRSMPPENRVLWRRLYREGRRHMCWWLERHTISEILELGRGIYFLAGEGVE